MPKVKEFKILVSNPQDVYYPGQAFNGEIFLDLDAGADVKRKYLSTIIIGVFCSLLQRCRNTFNAMTLVRC